MTHHRHNTYVGLSIGYVFVRFEVGEPVVKIPNEKELILKRWIWFLV